VLEMKLYNLAFEYVYILSKVSIVQQPSLRE